MDEIRKKLLEALKSLSFDGQEAIPNERENTIVILMLAAGEFEPVEDTIAYVEKHKTEGFEAVTKVIVHKWFPNPLEIVPDDELDDD